MLLGEAPGRVVVLERDFRAGDADILRLDIQPRQRDGLLHLLLEIADRHGNDVAGRRQPTLYCARNSDSAKGLDGLASPGDVVCVPNRLSRAAGEAGGFLCHGSNVGTRGCRRCADCTQGQRHDRAGQPSSNSPSRSSACRPMATRSGRLGQASRERASFRAGQRAGKDSCSNSPTPVPKAKSILCF